MKKGFAAFFLLCAPAWAGSPFGLASSVAKQHAKAIVAAPTPTPTAGSTSCSDAPLSVSMFDFSLPFHIEPLGHLAPSPHTFPTDHTYWQINKATSDTSSFFVFAPSSITITRVGSDEIINSSPFYSDYELDFVPCSGMLMRFGHLRHLSAELLAAVGPLTNCTDSGSFHSCTKNVSINLGVGEIIGTQQGFPGNTIVGLDVGLYDFNKPALPFISPERRSDYQNHTVCPNDSFVEPIRSNLNARFARYDGYPRTVAPLCGDVNQDLPGTAQGNWYMAGTPHTLGISESQQLALVHDNVTPSTGVFSVGLSVTGSSLGAGLYSFEPALNGFVNRDFSAITADTNVYCYDSFTNFSPANVILIQMPTSITLKIERQNLPSCGSGPWALTSAATDFER